LGFHEDQIKDCIRELIAKGEEVTVTKVSQRCNIPWRTVRNHFYNIIGQDLGDGTKVVHGKAVYDAVIRDPPGDQEMVIKVEPPEDKPPSFAWEDFAVGALTGTLLATSAILIGLVVRDAHHSCDWSPVVGADSWVRVCTICGRYGDSLNDQSAPIHLTPING
jgi:hypothetical protein